MKKRIFKYLPKDSPVVYHELKREKYHQPNIHMHDHNEILFITTDAVCDIFTNGAVNRIKGPACILHRRGSYHSTATVSVSERGYAGRAVFYDAGCFDELPPALTRGDTLCSHSGMLIPLDDNELEAFLPYLELMRVHARDAMQMKLLLCCIADLICPLTAKPQTIRVNTYSDYIFDAIAYVAANADAPLSAATLAERFFVSVSKFNSDFKRVTGLSVKQYLIQLRLANARRMIASGQTRISEVAYSCGFSGESYFIQVFKAHYGITPGQYAAGEMWQNDTEISDISAKKQ